jgi:LPS export ABC transporter protein LptC
MMYRAFVVLMFTAVIVGSLILSRQRSDTATTSTAEEFQNETGYFARNAELIETGPDGRPMYTLRADVIRQKPSDGTVDLEIVRMSMMSSDGQRWDLQANRGHLRDQATRIDLFGDVRVSGALPPEAEPAEIRTEMLTFDTEAEVVSTSAPVSISWSGRELTAVGLRANLKERQVRLESRVHGRFSP